MGQKFFGVDVQKVIADAVPKGAVPAFTLRKQIAGAYTGGHLAAGPAMTTQDFVTRGVMTAYGTHDIPTGSPVQAGDQKVLLIALPLINAGVEPAQEDQIVDSSGRVYEVVFVVDRDPAVATFEVACRG